MAAEQGWGQLWELSLSHSPSEPRRQNPEIKVGPDPVVPGFPAPQYDYDTTINGQFVSVRHCLGGSLFDSGDVVQWGVSSAYTGPPPNAAFAWSNLDGPPPVSCATNPASQLACLFFSAPNASQFNPESCRTDPSATWRNVTYLNGTWDTDVAANDP